MQYCLVYSYQIVRFLHWDYTHTFLGGLKYGDEIIDGMKQLAPLKDATDMGDCADAFVMLAKNGELATY